MEDIDHQTGGPARYVRIEETQGRVGFITPLTHNFCESCNRVRLTCTGTLYMCLGQEDAADLRSVLRAALLAEARQVDAEDLESCRRMGDLGAALLPAARYLVFHCADRFGSTPYYESIDLIDAFHPQTILAWRMNGAPLTVGHPASNLPAYGWVKGLGAAGSVIMSAQTRPRARVHQSASASGVGSTSSASGPANSRHSSRK